MNLADIRKKAQKAEVQWGPKPSSGQGLPASGGGPEPFLAGEPPELAELLTEPVPSFRQAEPADALLPADFFE